MRKHLIIAALTALAGVTVFVGVARSKTASGTVKGSVGVKVKGTAKADRSGVVVYLENVPGTPVIPKDHAAIRQREKQFVPPLTIVVRGTTVDFPNEDKIFHNVFSVSRPARFDLGLYKSGTTKSVEMKRSGTIDVYCNIHPDMIAKVKVLENGYYTITAATGEFTLDGVPPGEYPIVAWLPSGEESRGKVKVTANAVARVTLEVDQVAGKETHARKDGTPYGRYK